MPADYIGRTLSRVSSQTMAQKTGKKRSINGYIVRIVAINQSKICYPANDVFHLQAMTAIMR